MSIVPDSSLELIEHLDFEHAPQCEHSGHGQNLVHDDGPAYVLVRARCPECDKGADLYLCRRKWESVIAGQGVMCNAPGGCGAWGTSHQFYTALGWVE